MEIITEIGMLIFFFGSCTFDSADLRIPAIICGVGLLMMLPGMMRGKNYDRK